MKTCCRLRELGMGCKARLAPHTLFSLPPSLLQHPQARNADSRAEEGTPTSPLLHVHFTFSHSRTRDLQRQGPDYQKEWDLLAQAFRGRRCKAKSGIVHEMTQECRPTGKLYGGAAKHWSQTHQLCLVTRPPCWNCQILVFLRL